MAKKSIIDPKCLKDEKPKPKKKKVETPLEKRNKIPKFTENYEESLIRQLFEEKENKIKSIDLSSVREQEDKLWVHHKRNGAEWDVPIDEKIEYFDPELSYEITGYRPITMEQGLDFDPEPFRECAITFESTGKYTEFPNGSVPNKKFWNREMDRLKNGLTIGKYRITGDHYYFLNYYRMQTVLENATAGTGREYNFPTFLSKQYEWFHYVEMAEKLGLNVGALKGRGTGWSEMTAAMSVRPYTSNPAYRVVLTAFDDGKLQPLRDKCWYQLNWLNANAYGFRHIRQVVDNAYTKRASKRTKEGAEVGWMAEIHSIIADKPSKIRGDRTDRLVYEEAGSNTVLSKSWIQGDSLVELGGKHFGTKIFLGTGGDDTALEGLATMFKNPRGAKVLPYKNYDTTEGDPEITCFFCPSHKFALVSEYLDNRGVTDWVRFKKHYEEYRKTLHGQDYLDECAEHCFTPEEALSKTGENLFDAELIAARMSQIMTKHNWTEPKKMMLLWDKTTDKQWSKINAYESPHGNVLVVEPPLTTEDGSAYKNLYVAGIDSIDIGQDESASDTDVSDFCIVIKKRIRGMDDPKYVAIYKERPRDIRQAYETAHKLLVWYNCNAMLEATKIGIQRFLEERKASDRLMKRPEYAVSSRAKKIATKKLIGLTATESVIKHGLELVGNFLNDYWYTIDFPDILQQLLKYSYSQKRKFDIVAALQMAEAGDEELFGLNPAKVIDQSAVWVDFGYFRDKNGHIQHGAIPSNNKYETRWKT